MTNRILLRVAFAAALPLLLIGCQTPGPWPAAAPASKQTMAPGSAPLTPELADAAARAAAGPPTAQEKAQAYLYRGSGVVVKGQQQGGGPPPAPVVQAAGGGVVLNFEGADLREVVRNILGDILNENYTIDPAVGGTVTIRTSSGIPREALPATLETLLRANGATMVKSGGLYMVVPQAAAVRGNVTPQLGNSTRALPPGFSVQIVPLRYVGVREMLRILEPFAKDAQAVRPDELRNMLVLSGTERELRHLMDTIEMFDIDWMTGMSAGVFTLQNSDVKSVMAELEKLVGDRNTSPITGILKIVPIERMNALLVVTPQPAYLEEVRKWIERLDRGGEGGGLQMFVYVLQNTRAERLGPLLQQAFTGRVTQPVTPSAPTVAPGTPAGTIVNPPPFSAQPTPPVAPPSTVVINQPPAAAGGAGGQGIGLVRNLQVVADKDNNTLLVIATAAEYSIIETALKKLDIPQRQVFIDVTIAEVTLTDDLKFGVEWLFKGGAPSGRGAGGLFNLNPGFNPGMPLTSTTSGGVTTTSGGLGTNIAQGFLYFINNANFPGGIQAALHLLDTFGSTKVVANPHVAAADNQKATIKSGNRIPINQSTLVGGTTNAVTTTAQYIDTGVLLQVTPHINAGGLISLDVQAEVSVPGTASPAGSAPPINTRSVQTFVTVQSGQTMVMGGLISDSRANTSEGLPLLSRIPILGGLFGNQDLKNDRTELVLFITPRVVETEIDMQRVIEDLRRRMENMDRFFPYIKPFPAEVFPPKPAPPPAEPPAELSAPASATPSAPPSATQ